VKGIGGDAAIESSPHSGTAIQITLPASADTVTTASEPEAPVSSRGRGERILVVEDESGVREPAVLMLTAAGYEVTSAASAEEAWRMTRVRLPDLLLSDVVMADASGGELALRLRAEAPSLPILFMSGYPDDVVARHLVRERRLAFLEKPFTSRTLLKAVRAALPLGVSNLP
jgi:two-component system, NtrC family, sensor kinase